MSTTAPTTAAGAPFSLTVIVISGCLILYESLACVGEHALQHDGVLVDERAILVVLLGVGAQQGEILLHRVEMVVLKMVQQN